MRAGVRLVTPLPVVGPSEYQPTTSATTLVLPLRLNMLTLPPVPTLTGTRLGMVSPAAQFRFDAVGLGWPVGHPVRKDGALVSVAVTLSTTADTPLAGTPPAPVTVRSSDWPGPNGELC